MTRIRQGLARVDGRIFTGRGQPLAQHGRGRRCAQEGCSTVLRATRPGEWCAVHELALPPVDTRGHSEGQQKRRLREARRKQREKTQPPPRSHECGPADGRRLDPTRRHQKNHQRRRTECCEWAAMSARYYEFRRRNPGKPPGRWVGWKKYGIRMAKGQQ